MSHDAFVMCSQQWVVDKYLPRAGIILHAHISAVVFRRRFNKIGDKDQKSQLEFR